ncbi:hypothetical protein [Endozoicomonas sp. SCSIO W0465]|uniref:hypothetical protein n=1 Tax=Endozoicomonas sp. SCSIO W0465 TaxID=2918516 RepID=UPI002074D4E6|nr:hypothetical protein [Endozoicomonas sp. SCSIO W0465]USE39370.1 hypothetical protein MJO57_15135 [Endozoicomonas sp. SCSIO W0465]
MNPDAAKNTEGKYSGRKVISDTSDGSLQRSHQKAESGDGELTKSKSRSDDTFEPERKALSRYDSGFGGSVSESDVDESITLLPPDSTDSSDSVWQESDSSGGEECYTESIRDHGGRRLAGNSDIQRKDALRFAVVLNANEMEVLKHQIVADDIDYFMKCFDELKGDFFHTGDYLVEHIDGLYLKIQKRFVRFSDVSTHSGQLVFWWNLLCKEAQNHLRWCGGVELKPLDSRFIQSVEKRKRFEQTRSKLYAVYLNKRTLKTQGKAAKAQHKLDHFKSEFYLPQIEELRHRLCEMSEKEKSRKILGQCHGQLSNVLHGNVRNIVGEVDKWSRNLMLNRLFLESGLATNDIIS